MTNAPWLAPAFPAALALSLSACTSLGADTFVFEGDLPANFGIEAQAHYAVVNGCTQRMTPESFEAEIRDSAQHYRFRIPSHYHSGGCELRLARIGLYIKGRYGEKDWQQTYTTGGLELIKTLPAKAPDFDAQGVLSKRAECMWLFQISPLRLELSKLLSCKNAGAFLTRDELAGKTVRLDFTVTAEEEPYRDNTWVQFENGWKPCIPKAGGWLSCQKPPVFKKFKMNGQECTVYPNCTE